MGTASSSNIMDSNHSFSWSKFETQTKNVFNNLMSDTDFLDVTLVTDDDKQIKAHKVILSASSPFFRKILSLNPHPHPLLYLKGVSSSSLGSILQFMYLGEVNIALDNLDAFLQASEDLKVIGMLDMNQEDQSNITGNEHVAKRPRIEEPEVDIEHQDDDQLSGDNDIANIQAMINIEQEDHVEVELEEDEDDDIVEILDTPAMEKSTNEPETHFCDKL